MKRRSVLLIAAVLVLSLTACAKPPGQVAPVDLQQQFGSFQGTFKLYDLTDKTYRVYRPELAAERRTPASTFKVLHSLIALQTGVVTDEAALKDAVDNSVIAYFQAIARKVGREQEQAYLDKVGFGNRQIGKDLEAFWLDGSLTVSADEQLAFMTRLYEEQLPFDARVMQTVKRLLIREQTDTYTLAGKTGSAVRVTPNVGWYVGYLVTNGKPYTFVTQIEGDSEASGIKAREITDAALRELGLIPR